jgi:hypothetical protein
MTEQDLLIQDLRQQIDRLKNQLASYDKPEYAVRHCGSSWLFCNGKCTTCSELLTTRITKEEDNHAQFLL